MCTLYGYSVNHIGQLCGQTLPEMLRQFGTMCTTYYHILCSTSFRHLLRSCQVEGTICPDDEDPSTIIIWGVSVWTKTNTDSRATKEGHWTDDVGEQKEDVTQGNKSPSLSNRKLNVLRKGGGEKILMALATPLRRFLCLETGSLYIHFMRRVSITRRTVNYVGILNYFFC